MTDHTALIADLRARTNTTISRTLRDTSDDEVIDLVRSWVDQYGVGDFAWMVPVAACLRDHQFFDSTFTGNWLVHRPWYDNQMDRFWHDPTLAPDSCSLQDMTIIDMGEEVWIRWSLLLTEIRWFTERNPIDVHGVFGALRAMGSPLFLASATGRLYFPSLFSSNANPKFDHWMDYRQFNDSMPDFLDLLERHADHNLALQ